MFKFRDVATVVHDCGLAHLMAVSLLLKCSHISPQWQGLVQLLLLEGEPGDGVLESMLKAGAALTVLTEGPANESRGGEGVDSYWLSVWLSRLFYRHILNIRHMLKTRSSHHFRASVLELSVLHPTSVRVAIEVIKGSLLQCLKQADGPW